MTYNQWMNLVTFVALMNGENTAWVSTSPDYMREKYTRYVNADFLPTDRDEWQWGVHPLLKQVIEDYCRSWGINPD